MNIDLAAIGQRLSAAAERTQGMKVTISATDLIISKDGYGTGRSEGLPLAALFLQKDDKLNQAIDRLLKG